MSSVHREDYREPPEAMPPPASRPCPHCGAELSERDRWCPLCGKGVLRQPVAGEVDVELLALRAWRVYQREMGRIIVVVWLPLLLYLCACVVGAVGVGFIMDALENFWREQFPGVLSRNVLDVVLSTIALGLAYVVHAASSAVAVPPMLRSLLEAARGPTPAIPVRIHWTLITRAFLSSIVIAAVALVILVLTFGAATALFLAIGDHVRANAILGAVAGACATAGFLLPVLLMLAVWPCLFVLVDRNPPGVQCLRVASAITRGGRVAVLPVLVFAGIVLFAGALALGIGLLLVVPYLAVLATVTYAELAGQDIAEE